MGKGKPPPAPDYVGAAQQQGQANLETAIAQGKMNNPNVTGPYGSQNVTWGNFDQPGFDAANQKYQTALSAYNAQPASIPPQYITLGRGSDSYQQLVNGTGIAKGAAPTSPTRGQFTSDPYTANITQTLSPGQQSLLDKSTKTQGLLADLASQGATSAQGILGQKVDYSQAPQMPGSSSDLRDQVYNASMSRVNHDIGIQRDDTNSNLVAAGIHPGSAAYDNSMNLINRQQTDAQQQAILNSGNQAQQAQGIDLANRNQYLQEYQQKLNTPLNQITALMSGSQVNNPFQTPGFGQSGQAAPAPIYAATNAQGQYGTDVFNQHQQSAGNVRSGLFGLGASAIGAYGAAYGAAAI